MRTEDKYDWLFENSPGNDTTTAPIEADEAALKVGSPVRILHSPTGIDDDAYIGQIGVIMKIDPEDDTFSVRIGRHLPLWYRKAYIEPVGSLRVGDKVHIKSREWYEKNKNSYGNVDGAETFVPAMVEYCGNVYEIVRVIECGDYCVYKLEGTNHWGFSEEMFDFD